MQMAEATDTAADLPAMFRAALDYLAKNKPGSAEIWVASDLQASNWRPDSAEWQDIAARFAGLPQGLSVRILDLSSPPGQNLSISMKSAELRVRDPKSGKAQLSLAFEVKADTERKGRSRSCSRATAPRARSIWRSIPSFSGRTSSSTCPRRNPAGARWNCPPTKTPRTIPLISPTPRRCHCALRSSAMGRPRRVCASRLRPTKRARIGSPTSSPWPMPAAWRGRKRRSSSGQVPPPDEAVAKSLQSWVEGGGVLLCFPGGADVTSGPLGIAWGTAEDAPKTLALPCHDLG